MAETHNNILGIQKNFNSKIVLCGWHLQKNFISRFSKLKGVDEDLYNKILSLPFVISEEKFQNIIEEVEDSEFDRKSMGLFRNETQFKKFMG